MQRLLIVTGLSLSMLGGLAYGLVYVGSCGQAPPSFVSVAPQSVAHSVPAPDSTFLGTMGVVGAGGEKPLLALTKGRVEGLFFSRGDYARRGQVLVKLSNHTYVKATRAGFLGPNQVTIGQYIFRNTVVTTISRHSYLEVLLLLPRGWQGDLRPGDSARVWSIMPPVRMVTGFVGTIEVPKPGETLIEIMLTSRAPFSIGEQTYVQLQDKHNLLTVR